MSLVRGFRRPQNHHHANIMTNVTIVAVMILASNSMKMSVRMVMMMLWMKTRCFDRTQKQPKQTPTRFQVRPRIDNA